MPVLSIIACRILEDELAHVLSEDSDLKHLILVDNPDCLGLSGKMRSKNRSHLIMAAERIPDLLKDIDKDGSGGFLRPLLDKLQSFPVLAEKRSEYGDSRNKSDRHQTVVVVNVLRMALHADGKLLREEVCRNIDLMSRFSDGILLFYGLCGNALADLNEDFVGSSCPVRFLTDGEGRRVDDCIAVSLGGNKQYEETLSKYPGVGIFFTPMWAFNCREIDNEVGKSSRSKSLGKMLNDLGYEKVARLDTGLHFISDFEVETKIKEFAELYNLKVVSLQGKTDVVDRCYRQAKEKAVFDRA